MYLLLYTHICKRGTKLLSKIPVDIKSISEGDIDKEILRAAIVAELDAVNLYEQMANLTKDENIKAVLMDVAKEEKTHIGEFQALLLQFDPQHKKELEAGAKEAEEVSSK
jgi:rubrerythrin